MLSQCHWVVALNTPRAEVPGEETDPIVMIEGEEKKDKTRQEVKRKGKKRIMRTGLPLSRRNEPMPCVVDGCSRGRCCFEAGHLETINRIEQLVQLAADQVHDDFGVVVARQVVVGIGQ